MRVVPLAPGSQVEPTGVSLALVVELEGDVAVVLRGGDRVAARLDPAVHPLVIEGAIRRGERVLVASEGGELVVVGALRTQPTPGIDRAPEYEIAADRLRLVAGTELSLTAKTAAVVLRAIGEVETYADRVISRAEGVHKIIGRMLRLN